MKLAAGEARFYLSIYQIYIISDDTLQFCLDESQLLSSETNKQLNEWNKNELNLLFVSTPSPMLEP